MKKAIIIGASSGIGRELALILNKTGYIVGVTARRMELLKTLNEECNGQLYVEFMDISNEEESLKALKTLIEKLNGLDLIIISSGVGFINEDLELEKEKKTINVNVMGFTAIVNSSYKYFLEQKSGHIVGISSVASIRGSETAPAYSASKAYLSNYLEGLRKKSSKLNVDIKVLDVLPGFVDTDMAQGEGLFWVAPPQKAAKQIFNAIKKNKKKVYITKRWELIGKVLKILPDWVYYKI